MPDELAVFELAPLSCCSWNRYVPAGNGSGADILDGQWNHVNLEN